MHYGNAIRKKLIDDGLDQTWLAKELGVSRQAVHFMCSKRHINTARLHEICQALDTTVMDLLVKENK